MPVVLARHLPSTTVGRGGCLIPLTSFASGWMRVRARARQRGIELPLVVSDHADWPELIRTIHETGARRCGSRTAARMRSSIISNDRARGRALALIGLEDEESVKRFAELLDRLAYTPSRNDKLRLLADYFAATPDPDRGWALAALTDGLFFRLPLRRILGEMIEATHRSGAVRALARLCRRYRRDHRADLARCRCVGRGPAA